MVADDQNGITPKEALHILRRCRFAWLVLVELAIDFSPELGIDRTFVSRHGLFGKSRRRTDRGGPDHLRYGSRKSGKLIRSYFKKEVNAFRVEAELHSQILTRGRRERPRRSPYNLLGDLAGVPYKLFPKHLSFVQIDWNSLKKYAGRRFGPRSETIIHIARRKAQISLSAACQFLRQVGVNNVHRFRTPMGINESIDKAVTKWSLDFREYCNRVA